MVGTSPQNRLPRTELWISGGVYKALGLADDVAAHIALAQRLGMDYLFLPGGKAEELAPGLDYRTFSPQEVALGVKAMPTAIVLDGPFGRLAAKKGLWAVLQSWKMADTHAQLADAAAQAASELSSYLFATLKAVVIADDIAHQQGTYVAPQDLRRWLFPLHRPLVEAIHASGAYALFHSDGKLDSVLADLTAAGYDGLAGCQIDCQGEALLKAKGLLLLGGIDAPILWAGGDDSKLRREFLGRVNDLRRRTGLVLCSSHGIHSSAELERLGKIYQWVDEGIRS